MNKNAPENTSAANNKKSSSSEGLLGQINKHPWLTLSVGVTALVLLKSGVVDRVRAAIIYKDEIPKIEQQGHSDILPEAYRAFAKERRVPILDLEIPDPESDSPPKNTSQEYYIGLMNMKGLVFATLGTYGQEAFTLSDMNTLPILRADILENNPPLSPEPLPFPKLLAEYVDRQIAFLEVQINDAFDKPAATPEEQDAKEKVTQKLTEAHGYWTSLKLELLNILGVMDANTSLQEALEKNAQADGTLTSEQAQRWRDALNGWGAADQHGPFATTLLTINEWPFLKNIPSPPEE